MRYPGCEEKRYRGLHPVRGADASHSKKFAGMIECHQNHHDAAKDIDGFEAEPVERGRRSFSRSLHRRWLAPVSLSRLQTTPFWVRVTLLSTGLSVLENQLLSCGVS